MTLFFLRMHLRSLLVTDIHIRMAEPSKQFALVERHINRIRAVTTLAFSEIIIMCERNLGFEAEHHHRALAHIPNTRHRIDHAGKRYGILTTEEIKHQMAVLTSTMMREQRINIRRPLLSENPQGNARRIADQLAIYRNFEFEIFYLYNIHDII